MTRRDWAVAYTFATLALVWTLLLWLGGLQPVYVAVGAVLARDAVLAGVALAGRRRRPVGTTPGP